MKIQPTKISIDHTEEQYAAFMYITASDSWGNEEESAPKSYNAIAILKDIQGVVRKRLEVSLVGTDYEKWDGSNQTILQMFLDKYEWLKLIS
jgi:hypothetical protein